MPKSLDLKGGQQQSNEAFLLIIYGKILDISWLVPRKKKFRNSGGHGLQWMLRNSSRKMGWES